jgi:hypothetical protein
VSAAPAGAVSVGRQLVPALLGGLVSGALVLGAGGRFAMAALVWGRGLTPSFSWSGSLEVVALGTVYGLAGGFLLAGLRRRWSVAARPARTVRGVAAGAALCAVAWLTSPVGRSTARSAPEALALLVLCSLVLFALYGVLAGVLADALAARWIARGHAPTSNSGNVAA